MKQEQFEALYNARWKAFSDWLKHSKSKRQPLPFPASELPQRYRVLCQDLALARDRQYSADLVRQLNQLVLAGHQLLYGSKNNDKNKILDFIFGGFAELVRSEAKVVLSGVGLFFVPLFAIMIALQFYPDFIYYLLDPSQVHEYESMYSPDAKKLGRSREAASDIFMFGFYIWNNVRIGFQTFAAGLLFAIGSIFFLVVNGVIIGAVAGHLTQIGYITTFYSFVSGHGSFELTAIALCGAAGLKIGYALVAPGRLSRAQSVREAARPAIRIVYGAAGMLVIAAFIEAFWSSSRLIPPPVKYSVGIFLWLAVICYFLFVGRNRGHF